MGAVTGLFEIQGDITQEEFRAFVRRAFAGRQDVQAVQYAPLISTSQRAEFGPSSPRTGIQRGSGIHHRTAWSPPQRVEYLPIQYTYPASSQRPDIWPGCALPPDQPPDRPGRT